MRMLAPRNILAAMAFVTLAGCGQSIGEKMTEKMIESQMGENADIDLKNGSVRVTTDEGTFDMGGAKLPDDWPTDAPVYAGAKITYSASMNPVTGKAGKAVMFTTTDTAAKVLAYYKGALADEGWVTSSMMEGQGTSIITATKDDRVLSLMITTSGGETSVTLGVGKSEKY